MGDFHNVINPEYRVAKSFQGRYFINHTPAMTLPNRASVWAALFNPHGSGVNVFADTVTVSNFSTAPFRTVIWQNAMPAGGQAAPAVSAVNAVIQPPVWPEAAVVWGSGAPLGGHSLHAHVVGAQVSEKIGYGGAVILPPGGSLLVQIVGPAATGAQAEVAFAWWEELAP